MELSVKKELESAVKKAAKIIENQAKSEIGVYQPAIGEFDAWAELSASTKQDRSSKGYPENNPLLRSGKLRDSIESTAQGLEAAIGSNLDIAVWQELGTENIPPRTFLGTAAEFSKKKIKKLIGKSAIEGMLGVSGLGNKYEIDSK
jgi:HK97 gp10 family phage protein